MKILFMTDSHFKSSPPRYRIDDWYATQFAELDEILEIARDNKVDLILHGGDFLDKQKVSHQLITDLMKHLKNSLAPIYTLLGNHGLEGYNHSTVDNSGLGNLIEAGIVNRLDTYIDPIKKFVIRGYHTSLEIPRSYLLGKEFKDYTKIAVGHQYIIPVDSLPFQYVHPRDVETDANLFLLGHWHSPFNYGKFHNPGSIARWSIDSRKRIPQVLLIGFLSANSNELPTILSVPLKSASLAQWNLEAVTEEREREMELNKFVQSLESTTFENFDISEVVKQAGLKQEVSPDIIKEALSHIEKAKENLK
jgi:DNA repair exonuclease SbcCD nuclease subunit